MNTPRCFTGWRDGVFHISGTPARDIVRACVARGLVRFASKALREYVLENGPRPREFEITTGN